MKRLTTIILAVALLLSTTACTAKEKNDEAKVKSLYTKGLEMTQEIDKLAENAEYAKLFSFDGEINKVMQDIGANDYKTPTAVLAIEGFGEAMMKYMQSSLEVKLSKEVEDIVLDRLAASFGARINAASGTQVIAATSIATSGDVFLFDSLKAQQVYLYLYGNKYASLVTFTPNKDNIVTASSTFVIHDDFSAIKTPEQVKSFLADSMQIQEMTVSLVNE